MNTIMKALIKSNLLDSVSSHFDKEDKIGLLMGQSTVLCRVIKHQTFHNEDNSKWTAGYITNRDLNLLRTYPNAYAYVVNRVTNRKFLVDLSAAQKAIDNKCVKPHYKYDLMYCVQDLPKECYIEC